MTDRVHSLTVVLDQDIRTDDVQGIIDAILHLRHVATVNTHVADVNSVMALSRARLELRKKIFEALE